jgi:hypothetical protein
MPAKKASRVFVSYDYDHDLDLKNLLASQVIVICGYHTNQAVGVAAEVEIARETETPYYLLRGRKSGTVRRPQGTWFWEKMYPWTWENLRAITTGRV